MRVKHISLKALALGVGAMALTGWALCPVDPLKFGAGFRPGISSGGKLCARHNAILSARPRSRNNWRRPTGSRATSRQPVDGSIRYSVHTRVCHRFRSGSCPGNR
jgi:hypothetical protein